MARFRADIIYRNKQNFFISWETIMTKPNLTLAGQTVLVVGASSGIGEAVAMAANEQGATVILASRSVDRFSRRATQTASSRAFACLATQLPGSRRCG
jgi:NADPH:quinone reductase-like Zn-dependent oxidoreductase